MPVPGPVSRRVAAVTTGQQGTYVFTVDEQNSAKQAPVQVARTVDSLAVIASGVTEGEKVILTGQSRLTNGSKVSIKVAGSKGPPGGATK